MTEAKALLEYDVRKKPIGIALALLVIFGFLGGHRFYFKKVATAITMAVLTVVSAALHSTAFREFSVLAFIVLSVWLLIDTFLIFGWSRDHNLVLISQLLKPAAVQGSVPLPKPLPRTLGSQSGQTH